MKEHSCPKCDTSGKSVKTITLKSLLKEQAKERIGNDSYFFCKTTSCPVVYFDQSGGSVFEKDTLTVRIGIKENEAPRHVCYCFDHTIEEIEEQVAATGESTVLTDIASRMKEACWCETKSPMGSCCMSTVSKYIKAAKAKTGQEVAAGKAEEFKDCCADHREAEKDTADCCSGNGEAAKESSDCCSNTSKPAVDPGRKLGILATFGAVFTAVLSSACCWLPLLLIAFGASAAGVSGFFEAYRFWFLGATGLLLLLGFYLVYFRQQKCAPGSSCATPNTKLNRLNKVTLWVATVMVILFSFFPNYLGVILGDANAGAVIPDKLDQASLSIVGMTCEACTTTIQHHLSKVDGISYAHVDYAKATATIGVPKGSKIPRQALLKEVENAGYKATFQNLLTKTINIEGMTCEACAIGAQKKLSEVAGVQNVQVDYENKKATVVSKASVTDEALKKAVEAAGYKASIKNDPK